MGQQSGTRRETQTKLKQDKKSRSCGARRTASGFCRAPGRAVQRGPRDDRGRGPRRGRPGSLGIDLDSRNETPYSPDTRKIPLCHWWQSHCRRASNRSRKSKYPSPPLGHWLFGSFSFAPLVHRRGGSGCPIGILVWGTVNRTNAKITLVGRVTTFKETHTALQFPNKGGIP